MSATGASYLSPFAELPIELEPTAFRVPGFPPDWRVVVCMNEGTITHYAVTNGDGQCMNHDGRWDTEIDNSWLTRTSFKTLADAVWILARRLPLGFGEERFSTLAPTNPGNYYWRLPEAEKPGYYTTLVELRSIEAGQIMITDAETGIDYCTLESAGNDTLWAPREDSAPQQAAATPAIAEHDIVEVIEDCVAEDCMLHAGDIGTVVHIHNEGEAYQVEFNWKDCKLAVVTCYPYQIKRRSNGLKSE